MIQRRRIFRGAASHAFFPKLNCSTPFLLPARVQIHDHVHPTAPVLLVMMHAEVGMDVEKPAPTGLMQATAFETGIRDEARNSGKYRQPSNELGRIQFVGD